MRKSGRAEPESNHCAWRTYGSRKRFRRSANVRPAMRPSRLAVSWGPLFFDAAGLEFCKPSAEFGQFGRREPQDRFLDIFDRHGGRNSTPASELEEPLAGKP